MMSDTLKPDLCVIGAGSGGLSVAAGAAQMGADVVLVERGAMGGDCLNVGCVPSKALIAAAHQAQQVRELGRFGICAGEPNIDFEQVHSYVHDTIAAIAPNDSVERFEAMGVRVVQAEGQFTGPREITANGVRVRARRFVIATGSTAMVPPIPGLEQVAYLTNETIFNLTGRPDHLIVIGGGPVGVELAQSYRRLGAKVTVVELDRILGRDDPQAADVVRQRLLVEGVKLHEGTGVTRVRTKGKGVVVEVEGDGGSSDIQGSHLLVAVGRRPVLDGLGLDKAGIASSGKGIHVDRRLRTSNKRVFAIGDVIDSYKFTHVANYHAGIVIRNALFRIPAKAKYDAVPWVSYTDPELAQVGQTEAEARAQDSRVQVLMHTFTDNDRAQAERRTGGFIKIITSSKGRVLGATIVGVGAGELLFPWVLAIKQGLKVGALANLIVPYPTISEVSKRVAGSYFTPALFGARTRKLVRFLARLP
jgi:pyruvate/2-oxoglutarate dehydrogenase complex dihydrolipoamide dehydrogenase (E3) component